MLEIIKIPIIPQDHNIKPSFQGNEDNQNNPSIKFENILERQTNLQKNSNLQISSYKGNDLNYDTNNNVNKIESIPNSSISKTIKRKQRWLDFQEV